MPRYRIHGLMIESDFSMNGLEASHEERSKNDVLIAQGTLPKSLNDQEIVRRFYRTAPGQVLVRAREVGRLLISEGQRITYERSSDCDQALLAAHVLGSGLATIRHQRGQMVLHGASVCREGRAFLICGKSGAGKSTTTAHLLGMDGHTLGDDVAAVGDAPDFLVHPGPASTKLAEDALLRLPEYAAVVGDARCISGKRIIATHDRFGSEALPLAGIVVIERQDVPGVTAKQLGAQDAAIALHRHTFRKRFITSDTLPVLKAKWAQLAQAVPVWQVTRPNAGDTLETVVTMVQETLTTMTGNREQAQS